MYIRSFLVVLTLAGFSFAGDLKVIVGFKGDVNTGVIKRHGATTGDEIDGIDAMTATVPAARLAKLRADPSVAYVEEDGFVTIHAPGGEKGKPGGGGSTTPPPQVQPWGVTRVGAPGSNTGAGIKVAVIDTGIDLKHPDLHVEGDVTFVSRTGTGKDDHGHGTHVSGSIAALDNEIGVIGVAPDALLYAVKVLDRRGRGFQSDVAAGLVWAGDNGMHVANMSLGGGYSKVLQDACSYAFGLGVLLVAAAGNSGDGDITTPEISYPAAYGTVVAVAAIKSGYALASFSNSFPSTWDPYAASELHPVEVSAPGKNIRSTLKGGGYGLKSGTSMASPHAAGVAALLWKHLGVASSVTDVRDELDMTTLDLDPSSTSPGTGDNDGWDTGYGSGLVQVPPK